jgi:hypothetical protein
VRTPRGARALAAGAITDRGLAELIVLKKRQLRDAVGTIRRLVWIGESYRDFVRSWEPTPDTPVPTINQ